jgi:hypothetical protein
MDEDLAPASPCIDPNTGRWLAERHLWEDPFAWGFTPPITCIRCAGVRQGQGWRPTRRQQWVARLRKAVGR